MKKKTLSTLAITAVALLGFTACDDSPGGTVTEPEETTAENGQDDVQEEASPERPSFGETWSYDDGLAVTIGELDEFTPGEWASGGEDHDEHITFDVTIENETGEDFDPALISITAHSSGAEGEAIFDDENNLEGPPMTTLLDGQSTTFSFGFGVNDSSDVTVEFTDFGSEDGLHDPVIFVSE